MVFSRSRKAECFVFDFGLRKRTKISTLQLQLPTTTKTNEEIMERGVSSGEVNGMKFATHLIFRGLK